MGTVRRCSSRTSMGGGRSMLNGVTSCPLVAATESGWERKEVEIKVNDCPLVRPSGK